MSTVRLGHRLELGFVTDVTAYSSSGPEYQTTTNLSWTNGYYLRLLGLLLRLASHLVRSKVYHVHFVVLQLSLAGLSHRSFRVSIEVHHGTRFFLGLVWLISRLMRLVNANDLARLLGVNFLGSESHSISRL